MNLPEYLKTLKSIEAIANLSMSLDFEAFIKNANDSKQHIVKHGMAPADIDLLVQLAQKLHDMKDVVRQITVKSKRNRELIRNARTN